jgi:hypothetical protein
MNLSIGAGIRGYDPGLFGEAGAPGAMYFAWQLTQAW